MNLFKRIISRLSRKRVVAADGVRVYFNGYELTGVSSIGGTEHTITIERVCDYDGIRPCYVGQPIAVLLYGSIEKLMGGYIVSSIYINQSDIYGWGNTIELIKEK